MAAVPRSLQRQFPKLRKVFEARKPVSVEVTAADNKQGSSKDAANCAMARALCREFKADVAVVGLTYSYVIKGDTAVKYSTPPTLQREIVSFDRNHDFRPGTFGLSPVSPSHTASGTKARRKKAPGGKKAKTTGHQPKRILAKTTGIRSVR